MKKTICLGNSAIPYTLKRFRRSKRVRLSISRDRALLITAPKTTPFYFIEKILREKESWILRTFKYFEGLPIKYKGQVYGEGDNNGKKLYKKHKEEARVLVSRRLEYWNQFYNFSWGRISIRNQRTRWGSCSKKGNLNFNSKLALLPQELSDYVIVHELCHLKEFNHSKNFWELVALTISDWKERRKALHQH
ncbi:MAG: SprT family zinc-dependent metalloprotease [Candidatus Paceibacterota bacterium]|jgi:hypothetical protein